MKKYLLFLLFPILFSCTELDIAPLNTPTVDTYFKSVSDFEMFVNSTYQWSVPQIDAMATFDFASDLNSAHAGHNTYASLINGNVSPTLGETAMFFDYGSIRHAYSYFEQIAQFNEISGEQKANLDGQVYYLLAYRYFAMFRAYENVPVVTKVMTLEESDIPSSDKSEVFAEALKNVNLAITNLPSVLSERGRLTKLAAMALKADMILYAASRFNEAIAGATYADALTAANTALAEADSQGKGLANSYADLFIASRQGMADSQKEIILEDMGLKDQSTSYASSAHYNPDESGWGTLCATQEFVDAFPCIDGLPINTSPLYDSERPFKNRDPRLDITIARPGSLLYYVDGAKSSRIFNPLDPNAGNGRDYILGTRLGSYLTGYVGQKWWLREGVSDSKGYMSFIAYRYAELLLMAAEAENESSGPSTTVFSRISKLRQRVGMPAVNSSLYPDKSATRQLIRTERMIELAYEGKRYWDIRRYGIGENVLNKQVRSMHISRFNPDGSFKEYISRIYVNTDVNSPNQETYFDIPSGTDGGRLIFTSHFTAPRDYVWPIPLGAITSSENLEQHPLWQ
jgi:hypothetical protein